MYTFNHHHDGFIVANAYGTQFYSLPTKRDRSLQAMSLSMLIVHRVHSHYNTVKFVCSYNDHF